MRRARLAVLGLLAIASPTPSVLAQCDTLARQSDPPLTSIYLTSQAAVRLSPDRATVYLIVDAPAGTPSQASERAISSAESVLDTLRRLGLGPRAARLINYGAAPSVGTGGAGPMAGATFTARSVIRVELQRLELLSTVATAAFNRGATLIGPIQFGAVASDSARRAALASVMAQGRQDAEEMARAAGGRLGRLMDVNMHSTYSQDFNQQQLPLGGPQYQYDAASAWRTVPEIVRTWSVSTRWEIVRSGSGR